MLAQPIKVGVESRDQARKAGAEARIRYPWVLIEKDIVAVAQLRWGVCALQRSAVNGKDALAESFASPTSQAQISERAAVGESTKTTVSASLIRVPRRRFQSSPPEMPWRSMTHSKPQASSAASQLVGKAQVIAAVGDENAKLAPVGRVGSARLLRSYITWFRRSRPDASCGTFICTAPVARH